MSRLRAMWRRMVICKLMLYTLTMTNKLEQMFCCKWTKNCVGIAVLCYFLQSYLYIKLQGLYRNEKIKKLLFHSNKCVHPQLFCWSLSGKKGGNGFSHGTRTGTIPKRKKLLGSTGDRWWARDIKVGEIWSGSCTSPTKLSCYDIAFETMG